MRHRAVLLAAAAAACLATAADARTYSSPIWIAQPANGATVRNNSGNLGVTVALGEPLAAATGEHVELTLDGKLVGDSSDSQRFELLALPLGKHTLAAELRDRNDEVLLRSTPVVVDMAPASRAAAR